VKKLLILFLFAACSEKTIEENSTDDDGACGGYCEMVSQCSIYEYGVCYDYCSSDLEDAIMHKSQECYEMYQKGYICQGELSCMEWSDFWGGVSPYPCENVELTYYDNCEEKK
jgi:hypothetical protein